MGQVEVFTITKINGELGGDAGLLQEAFEKAHGKVLFQAESGDKIFVFVSVTPGTKIERQGSPSREG